MLDIINIHKTFNKGTINEKVALDGVTLHLNEGDFCTIIGGNGAGKSTTLNAVAGVWPVDSGQILIDGVDVTGLPEHKRAKYLGRVFQDPMTGTVADMEILENLALAARRGKKRGLSWGVKKSEKEEYRTLLKQFELGLEDRMTSKVGLLSGGQRQLLALAKLLLIGPELLLLDEPTKGLDLASRCIIARALREHAQGGGTVIMATHDLDFAEQVADEIAMMFDGEIACVEPPTDFFADNVFYRA